MELKTPRQPGALPVEPKEDTAKMKAPVSTTPEEPGLTVTSQMEL